MSTTTTKIQWTDRTWNPVRGCSRVSPGCDNCYAMKVAYRFKGPGMPYEGLATLHKGKADWTGVVREIPDSLDEPLRWRNPARIFVNSQSDLFHHGFSNEYIAAVFGVMAACPQHTFQVLTKRAERMREWFQWIHARYSSNPLPWVESTCRSYARLLGVDPSKMPDEPRHGAGWPLPNVWLGVSCEDQQRADERIPYLLETPAAVRFVSAEPLLGSLDLRPYLHRGEHRVCPRCLFATNRWQEISCPNDGEALVRDIGLDWVIVGGESGSGARPFDVAWAQAIVKQCRDASVPCFVKQLGAKPHAALAQIEDWEQALKFWTRHPGVDTHEVVLRDLKGGDPLEWPESLRVRQFPEST